MRERRCRGAVWRCSDGQIDSDLNWDVSVLRFYISFSPFASQYMILFYPVFKVKGRVPRKELRERLETDDIILILQQNRLRWYGHVLRKEDTDY